MCPGFDSFDRLVLDEWPRLTLASFDTELRELWKVSFELWWWESFELRGSGEDKTEKSTSTSITCALSLLIFWKTVKSTLICWTLASFCSRLREKKSSPDSPAQSWLNWSSC